MLRTRVTGKRAYECWHCGATTWMGPGARIEDPQANPGDADQNPVPEAERARQAGGS
jgi:hypothetical protein